jgi:hypothetical protein
MTKGGRKSFSAALNLDLRMQQSADPRHIYLMKTRCYQPVISRPLIAVLYHEARQRRMPMTQLINSLLTESLTDSQGWQRASSDWPELAAHPKQDQQSR